MSTEQYDTLTDRQITQLAHQLLIHYPEIYQGELTLLCRSENATFKIVTPKQNYAMRLHRSGYHDKIDIESELLWLDALSDAGIQVPQAIPTKQGERVQSITLDDGSTRFAVLFHWVDGQMPTIEVDPKAFFELGKITAQLHQHARQWKRPDSFRRIIWNHQTMVTEQAHWGRWQEAPHLKASDHEIIQTTMDHVAHTIQDYGQSPERYGLIHADLRLTNLLLHHGQTRVIDFDDCGMGWFMHDLAAAISFNEHLKQAPQWIDQWLNGYEQIAHLNDDDLDILPSMIIQRRIQMLAWTGTHADTEMTQSLGTTWADESVRLCRLYLERETLPVGVS